MSLQPGELLCRVCLQQDELLVDIFETVEELQADLCTLLETCGNIKVRFPSILASYFNNFA